MKKLNRLIEKSNTSIYLSLLFMLPTCLFMCKSSNEMGNEENARNQGGDSELVSSMIDLATPASAKPYNNSIKADWKLVFSDEFDDNSLDHAKWNINVSFKSRKSRDKLGIKSWYWKEENVSESDGNLILKVVKAGDSVMHCGSINSDNKFEGLYGYYETRIDIAEASKGTHTAFWLTGDNQGRIDGTANDGAEIDVFESAWLEDYTKAVLHIDGYGNDHKANTKRYDTPGIHDGFHIYGLLWTPDYLKIYFDGKLKVSYTEKQWRVLAPEYIWLSNGASFGYEGDNFTREPIGYLTEAKVDYVRVWQLDEYDL